MRPTRKRGRAAVNMHWVLAPDEALIIEFPEHDGLWTFTNMGVFFNSMDFLYRPVSYTPSRTAVDSDGTVRLILAHDDPGYHNWLDTQRFERGNITYRHMLEGSAGAAADPARQTRRTGGRATAGHGDRHPGGARRTDVGALQRNSAALRSVTREIASSAGRCEWRPCGMQFRRTQWWGSLWLSHVISRSGWKTTQRAERPTAVNG